MRTVNILLTDKGYNPAARDLTLNKVYPAVRLDIAADGVVDDGEGTCAYYVLVDDVRHPCGLCDKYLGVEIQEVQ